jgi:hypothetical protein
MDLRWLAGFFDGEGCVILASSNGGRLYYPRLTLAQKDRSILQAVQSKFGGHLHTRGCPPCSLLTWHGPSALALAEKLVRVCLCKRAQLVTLLESAKVSAHWREQFYRILCAQKREIISQEVA